MAVKQFYSKLEILEGYAKAMGMKDVVYPRHHIEVLISQWGNIIQDFIDLGYITQA